MTTVGRLCLLALLLLGGRYGRLYAQLDLLTVQEAESLIELIPEVRSAQQEGRCPTFSVSYFAGSTVWVQVRGAYPDAQMESALISNYIVDRRTGVVTEGEATPTISTLEMERLRTELLARARSRGLSAAEASCLAIAALKSRAAGREPGDSFVAKQVGRQQGKQMQFSAQHHSPRQHAITSGLFSVELSSGRVRDDETGMEVVSPELASVRANMLTVRFPPRLSVDAAVAIALQTPLVAHQVSGDCLRIMASGSGTPNDLYVGILSECPNRTGVSGPIAAVNLETGTVTDPKTLKDIGSADSRRKARELLERLKEDLAKARSNLVSACKAQ
jgi:hypothetical protein